MISHAPLGHVSRIFHSASDTLSRWFPRPAILAPAAVGIDISDTSIKWIALEPTGVGKRVRTSGQESLEQGVVVNGIVQDAHRLGETLRTIKEHIGIDCAHAALPEEAAYVFSMHVPANSSREQILSIIEFELEGRVPIPPSAAVYDFDVITKNDDDAGEEIGVQVFPKDLAESYAEAFSIAGISLLSLEVEASSVARAVSDGDVESPVTLLVDFGRIRTGFAVLKRGVPIFTSTVTVGGESIDKAILEKLALPRESLESFKNEEGLFAKGGKNSAGVEALAGTVASLADEIARHYHYWDTRRNDKGERVTPVERIYLLGGSSNLKGIGDYIAARVQVECVRPNVWQNVCSFDDYIPPVDRRGSLRFATAIGLALRSF